MAYLEADGDGGDDDYLTFLTCSDIYNNIQA
jgi:hypothetical protein